MAMKADPGGQTALTPNAAADPGRILIARGVRAFADGLAALLLLPIYLTRLGFGAFDRRDGDHDIPRRGAVDAHRDLTANRHSRYRLLVAAGVLNRAILAQPAAGDCRLPATPPDRAARR